MRDDCVQDIIISLHHTLTKNRNETINYINKVRRSKSNDIEKLELEKQNLEDKQNKLQNLVLECTIDKKMYASRKDEPNKKIKKIDKQQEELSRGVEDEAIRRKFYEI